MSSTGHIERHVLQLAKQVCRNGSVSSETLEGLESENSKLKKLLAEKLLENESMKDVLSKKW